jgi:eukaryotic-like serine/threonine-protein kinase
MARIFEITAASDTVRLGGDAQGEMAFTVTNISGRAVRGRAKTVPQDPALKTWLSISGEPERDFPVGGTQQFSVKVAVPAGTKSGKYNFRLDAVSVQNPDEDYTQGPNVAVSVTLVQPNGGGGFRWWMAAVAAVVLLAIGGAVWYLIKPSMVDVPKVVGLAPGEATKALSDAGLSGSQAGEEQTGKVAAGKISSQDPKPTSETNAKAPAKSTVQFKIESAAPVAQIPIPDVASSHMQLDPAIHAILDKGFLVDAPSMQFTTVDFAGKVLDQNPKGSAPPKTTIHLTVGALRRIDWRTLVSSGTLSRIQQVNPRVLVHPQ